MPAKLMTFILLLMLSASAGCFTAEEAKVLPALPSENNKNYIYSVAEVYELADQLHQKNIIVQGQFMGWNGCPGKTKMITRSDWVLSGDQSGEQPEEQSGDQSGNQSYDQPDDQKCILVSGDFPKGLNPRNKKYLGKNVIIKAVVIYQDGFLNLKNVSR